MIIAGKNAVCTFIVEPIIEKMLSNYFFLLILLFHTKAQTWLSKKLFKKENELVSFIVQSRML